MSHDIKLLHIAYWIYTCAHFFLIIPFFSNYFNSDLHYLIVLSRDSQFVFVKISITVFSKIFSFVFVWQKHAIVNLYYFFYKWKYFMYKLPNFNYCIKKKYLYLVLNIYCLLLYVVYEMCFYIFFVMFYI